MRTFIDVALTVLKLTMTAMLTSMVVFVVAALCSVDWWVAVVVGVFTVICGIIVGKVTKGVY